MDIEYLISEADLGGQGARVPPFLGKNWLLILGITEARPEHMITKDCEEAQLITLFNAYLRTKLSITRQYVLFWASANIVLVTLRKVQPLTTISNSIQ